MADKDLAQGSSLAITDGTRYVEIADGIYALVGSLGGSNGVYKQDFTGALVGISYPHNEIHGGGTFLASYKNPDATAIADNATITFTITTGSRYAHMIFRSACGGDMEVELLEGVAVTAGTGNAMNEFNKNRASARVATVGVRRDMTVVAPAGVLLENEFIPGGTGGTSIGGASKERPEWILALNTVYLFRATNRAGNAQPMSLAVEWYEESSNQ